LMTNVHICGLIRKRIMSGARTAAQRAKHVEGARSHRCGGIRIRRAVEPNRQCAVIDFDVSTLALRTGQMAIAVRTITSARLASDAAVGEGRRSSSSALEGV